MLKSLIVATALTTLSLAVGCAGPADDGSGASNSAISGTTPADESVSDGARSNNLWDKLVGSESKTYKSGGTSACGHSLTLTRGATPGKGSYVYSFTDDCDSETGGTVLLRSRGDFEVAAIGINALANPTLSIKPADASEEGWSYKILTAAGGEDGALPAGTLLLESNSEHHDRLLPEGFIP